MKFHKDKITEANLEKALAFVSKEDIADACFKIYDVRDTLTTIEELLDDVIMFLENLENNFKD